jgi:integrase
MGSRFTRRSSIAKRIAPGLRLVWWSASVYTKPEHTYASFMIAAGVNAKALSVFMGHSSIKVTFDLYGHLMPGTEAEAAALLDAFLSRGRPPAAGRRGEPALA